MKLRRLARAGILILTSLCGCGSSRSRAPLSIGSTVRDIGAYMPGSYVALQEPEEYPSMPQFGAARLRAYTGDIAIKRAGGRWDLAKASKGRLTESMKLRNGKIFRNLTEIAQVLPEAKDFRLVWPGPWTRELELPKDEASFHKFSGNLNGIRDPSGEYINWQLTLKSGIVTRIEPYDRTD